MSPGFQEIIDRASRRQLEQVEAWLSSLIAIDPDLPTKYDIEWSQVELVPLTRGGDPDVVRLTQTARLIRKRPTVDEEAVVR